MTAKRQTKAPFDHTLEGPPIISADEAAKRCPFLRTDVGRLRAFRVTRSTGEVIVKAHSPHDALAFADDAQWRILKGLT